MRKLLRDWLRGYSDEDIESVKDKFVQSALNPSGNPGGYMRLTPGEFRYLTKTEPDIA